MWQSTTPENSRMSIEKLCQRKTPNSPTSFWVLGVAIFREYTPQVEMEPKNDGFHKESPIPGSHFQVPGKNLWEGNHPKSSFNDVSPMPRPYRVSQGTRYTPWFLDVFGWWFAYGTILDLLNSSQGHLKCKQISETINCDSSTVPYDMVIFAPQKWGGLVDIQWSRCLLVGVTTRK